MTVRLSVSKGHHVRLFPRSKNKCDKRSGNCLAETVIDPVEFRFYLLSPGGIHGPVVRPISIYQSTRATSHHTCFCEIVVDGDDVCRADDLQSLYPRHYPVILACYFHILRLTDSTADARIVCSRARDHYNPLQQALQLTYERLRNSMPV